MFCKYCGKAIDEGTMRCRICGRPVGPLEGGNGFWDLAGEKKAETEGSADPEALQALREEVEQLRAEQKQLRAEQKKKAAEQKQPPAKNGAAPVLALLLGLLSLALGVFLLLQVRNLNGELQTLELRLAERSAVSAGQEGEDAASEDGAQDSSGSYNKWIGINDLDGIPLQPYPTLFDGPNKGKDDERGQSINLGLPEYGEETPIFTSRFLGQPGVYSFFWVKVESDEDTEDVYFTPLLEEDGYRFREPKATDANQTFVLSIMGVVKEEQLGRYAFVVVDPQTRSGYVSPIVELYDRAEQGMSTDSESALVQAGGEGNGS